MNDNYVKDAAGLMQMGDDSTIIPITFGLSKSGEQHIIMNYYFILFVRVDNWVDLTTADESKISQMKNVLTKIGGFATFDKQYADWLSKVFGITYEEI